MIAERDPETAMSTADYLAEVRAKLGTPGAAERHTSAHYRLRAAVIETANGPYFIKLTGPAKTIAAHDKAFEQFLSTVKYQP